jgi:UDP-glucose 4-epimerase
MTCYYSDKKAVVTGGAGFIGSHLVDALVSCGAKVLVLDSLQAGSLSNLKQSRNAIQFKQIDVRDYDTTLTSLDGADVIFHLAANASVPLSVECPRYDFESNVLGTHAVVEALAQRRAGRVVLASSAAVYGPPLYTPTDEVHPLNPISPYGISKMSAEKLGMAYKQAFGVDFLVSRIFNTYGPRQRKFVMFDLLNKLHKTPDLLTIMGDGMQIRDYSYVTDTVAALLLIGELGVAGEIYNIAGGNPISIRELADLLIHMMGVARTQCFYTGESWQGDVNVMVANIEKLQKLGFAPRETLANGIEHLYEWMMDEIWGGTSES